METMPSRRAPPTKPLLLAVPAVAIMLAEQGEPERAVELYALAWRHPVLAGAQCFIDSFGQELDTVVAALPPASSAAAQARGQALDLWETAGVLYTQLVARGWGQKFERDIGIQEGRYGHLAAKRTSGMWFGAPSATHVG